VLILDTAGHLHIDEPLMEELDKVKKRANPIETLLVVDVLEVFHPDRFANRILDKVLVSLVEKAIDTLDKEESERLNKKIEKGSFDLSDMASQLQQMMKMGGFSGLLSFLPGMGQLKDKLPAKAMDDRLLKRQIAIIQSIPLKKDALIRF